MKIIEMVKNRLITDETAINFLLPFFGQIDSMKRTIHPANCQHSRTAKITGSKVADLDNIEVWVNPFLDVIDLMDGDRCLARFARIGRN